jgi:hypothetical protein
VGRAAHTGRGEACLAPSCHRRVHRYAAMSRASVSVTPISGITVPFSICCELQSVPTRGWSSAFRGTFPARSRVGSRIPVSRIPDRGDEASAVFMPTQLRMNRARTATLDALDFGFFKRFEMARELRLR